VPPLGGTAIRGGLLVPDTREYRLLGPLSVRRDRVAVPVPPGKQQALLAALLLRAGQLVAVEELTEALWGAGIPASSRASLLTYVARLRQALAGEGGSPIVTEPGGYRIEVAPGELDVARFEAAVAAGQAAARGQSWAEASRLMHDALALWRGEPLSGVDSDLLITRDVPRLKELRSQALETRIDADLHLGRHVEVIAELRTLTASQPLRERLHGLLMVALYRNGQQAAALAAYQVARTVLLDQLGTEPGQALQQLQARVLTSDPALSLPEPAEPGEAGPPLTEIRYSLPPDTAGFTGRGAELDTIVTAGAGAAGPGGVVAIRAVNGMPGVGKTALAVHAGHLLASRFPDRQLFVDLRGHTPDQEPLTAGDALGGLLAAAGVQPLAMPPDLDGRTALWRDRMAGRRALLVLDNAESSAQVTPLLPGSPDCLVVVTSRRQLADLPGAVPLLLEVLSPGQAADMFTRLAPRAAAEPAAAVTELAELAGCLPLAISLLARVFNRHPAWTLADLAAETQAGLLTLAAENDSVAAAFRLSWQQLDDGQRRFFALLGLYPGTAVDAYAAAALAGVPLDRAARLLDGLHGEGLLAETGYHRFGMHDLIRQYAADRAAALAPADRDQATDRLLDYYQYAAGRADELLAGQVRPHVIPVPATPPAAVPALPDADAALAWLRLERETLVACLDRAGQAGQRARVVALTMGLSGLLRRDGPWTEAIIRHGAAVRAAGDLGDRVSHATSLLALGDVLRMTGDMLGAIRDMRAALGIFRDEGIWLGEASALCELGRALNLTGQSEEALQALAEAQAIFRAQGSRLGQAGALRALGNLRRVKGDYPGATRDLGEALAIYREVGDRLSQANVLVILGCAQVSTGDYPGAAELLTEAIGIFRAVGGRLGLANATHEMALVRLATGDLPAAEQAMAQALGIYRDFRSWNGEGNALCGLGTVRRAAGNYQAAAEALTEALGIYRNANSRLGQANALCGLGAVRTAQGDYAAAAWLLAAALGLFREVRDPQGEAEALNETGILHRVSGDPRRAGDVHREALAVAVTIRSRRDQADALAGLGRCALADGAAVAATRLLTQARQIYQEIGAAEAASLAAELDRLAGAASAVPARRG
jgi:DNA-binding SARP family transcriptional activator/tetratricopeptide (TPR) repeat protein